MATIQDVQTLIDNTIKTNNNQEITGQVLNNALTAMLNNLSQSYAFGGVATPSTNPGTPEVSTFYLATEAGTYTYMGGLSLSPSEFAFLVWDGEEWRKDTVFDYQSLPTAIGTNPFDLISLVVEDGKFKQTNLATMLPYLEDDVMYGIEWDVTVSSPACTRIGNMSLHRSLPIQNRMKGCLLDDDGKVTAYLPADDWTGATLDGSAGQVMVEIPMHYRKFETDGHIRRCKISEYPVPGYHVVPKMYISAYEATVQRSTNKLASVMNNSTDYRGGSNRADWDGTYRTLLGRPASILPRSRFREYARNRKSGTSEWNCQDYNAYKAVFWLFVTEYANRNSQLAFTAEKDANGYAQGGLGNGVSTISAADWTTYFSFQPFVPCGHTNSLGNASGEIAYDVTLSDNSILATVNANRYRGIENPFGHIWKWTDGINLLLSPTSANGGDDTTKVYIADDPANYNDDNYDGYSMRGLAARNVGYVREVVFGDFGDIAPFVAGGGSTTYWADYIAVVIPTTESLFGVLCGGDAYSGDRVGLAYLNIGNSPNTSNTHFGTRLCFIPSND